MSRPTDASRPVLSLLTDFGSDGAVAACHGVMLGICPDAVIIDVSHAVRKFAITDGAFILRTVLPYLPVGTHVGVVDPGVGTARRPVAIATRRGDVLIGPDNGLLLPAAGALGGVAEARELRDAALWLPGPSTTFHGRDIFSPVAAHLAAGHAALADVGPEVAAGSLTIADSPRPLVRDGLVESAVIYVDSFGNLRLAGGAADLDAALDGADATRLRVSFLRSGRVLAEVDLPRAPSFGHVEPGASLLYVDSSGNLAVADNQGNIAERLGIRFGDGVRIGPA